MPKKKHLVTLADDERQALEHLLPSGTHATRKVTRARILLKAAEGWEDQAIAAALSVGRATVERLRQRFVEEGLGRWQTSRAPGCSRNWMRRLKRVSSLKPVGRRRQGASAGPCSCWPPAWWPSA
jgi:Homeodomain-like domain